MRRRGIVIIAGCIALLAGLAPLFAMAWLSRERAVEAETRHLADYAQWTLLRSEMTLDAARDALRLLQRERWSGCGPDHIARMRQISADSQFVEEIGHYTDGRIDCTSWGPVRQMIGKGRPDRILPDGFALYIGVHPHVSAGSEVLVLSDGVHNALIRPGRLVDVLRDGRMALGVATADGRLIATSGRADPALVDRLAHGLGSGMNADALYASINRGGLIAFAITDRSAVQERIDGELVHFIPAGMIVSAILLAIVAWVSRQRLSPQAELAIAIRRREFVAHYQPIIELETGLCVGAEALIRWHRPGAPPVPPDQFIPLAEQTGLVRGITDLMIEQAVRDLARMRADEHAVHIAINLSAADIESGRFLPVLDAAIARAGVAPRQIWLEATERGFMQADAARRTIEAARARGHLVAIDDFGTGFSSLSLLESLPLDALKIDKTFVDAIGKSAATSVVTPHIIEMALGLGFRIVAEGVETREQEEYLRTAGVGFAQGWLYAPALPADEFIAFYRRCNGGRTASFMRAA